MDRSGPIIIEQELNTTPENVWRTISEPEQMRKWYFENIPAFEAKVSFEIKFNVSSNTRDFLHQWKVTEVEPLEKLVYEWSFEGIEGRSFSIFEVTEQDSGCMLKLTCIGLDTFPEDIPEFKRESAIAGWNCFIKERLVEFLNGR